MEDRAYDRRAIDGADGDVVLVDHNYGGAVVAEAGNDPKVGSLVYVAAFTPDKSESAASLGQRPATGAVPPPVLPARDGYLLIDQSKFPGAFAQDVSADEAGFMAHRRCRLRSLRR